MWSPLTVYREALRFPLDPERWTNIPLLVKILKLIINELSNVMEANAARQATPAEWSQGAPNPYLPWTRLTCRIKFLVVRWQLGLFRHRFKWCGAECYWKAVPWLALSGLHKSPD